MSVAIEQQSEPELYHYLIGSILKRSMEELSERLGRDERLFWRIVRVSKGDNEAPAKLKIGNIWINTTEFAERLSLVIWLDSMNGKAVSGDIETAKAFLNIITEEVGKCEWKKRRSRIAVVHGRRRRD